MFPPWGSNTHECAFREGEAFSVYSLSHPPQLCFVGETVSHGEEEAVFAMIGWFDLRFRSSSCTGGCCLFVSEFHFMRQSAVVGCCPFLRTFLKFSCTKRFERPESKAWDFQIWDALKFSLYLLNFNVSTLTTTLIIPLKVIIQLELHLSKVFMVLLRLNQCLLFTSANFLQTRQVELPTSYAALRFHMKPMFCFQGRSVERSLLASNDKSSWQSLLPFDSLQNSLWQAMCEKLNLLQLSERCALLSFLFCLVSCGNEGFFSCHAPSLTGCPILSYLLFNPLANFSPV